MEWLPMITVFLSSAGLIVWFRTESRNDWKHLDNELKESQKETRNLMESNHKETYALINAIKEEMKDFHGRLCAIEERNRKK